MRRPSLRRLPSVLPLTGFLALLASSCAVGPDYARPAVPLSGAFREPPPEGWKHATPRDDASRGPWWELFADSRLAALESQVAVSNQTVAQAEAQLRAARALARGARSDLFPLVTVSPSVSRAESQVKSSGVVTPVTGTTYQAPFGLSWEADVFGRIRRNVEAGVAGAQASAADLESVKLAVQAQLAADWFALRGTDAQLKLLETAVANDEKALDLTRRRHDQGVVSGVDVAQAETQLETARVAATDLSITRAQLEHAIAVLVGKPPAELTVPTSPLDGAPPEVPLALPSELLERRPDIAAAERRVAVANAQVGVATAGFFPRLLLSASGGWQGSALEGLFAISSRVWSLGASVAETLFDAGKRRANVEQARAAYDASVAVYRQVVLTSFEQVEDDLASLRLLEVESRQQAAAVAAADRALAIARSRYEGGVTTYLEVITAESAALSNERAAVQLKVRQMSSTVDLVHALGGGWEVAAPAAPVVPRGE